VYEKLTNFTLFLPENSRKNRKIPQFFMIFARKVNKISEFHVISPQNSRILRNNCPKNIFPESWEKGGGGTCPLPLTPTPTPMLRQWWLMWTDEDLSSQRVLLVTLGSKSYEKARESCITDGGDMVTPYSTSIIETIAKTANSSSTRCVHASSCS